MWSRPKRSRLRATPTRDPVRNRGGVGPERLEDRSLIDAASRLIWGTSPANGGLAASWQLSGDAALATTKLLAYIHLVRFEWDREKAARNERLHDVSFEQASEVFRDDADVLEIYDAQHSSLGEERYKTIGPVRDGLVLVVWTERDEDVIRIISAWWATDVEQKIYVKAMEERYGR